MEQQAPPNPAVHGGGFRQNVGTGPAAQGLPATIICATCQAENPAGMKFCRNCGSAVGHGVPAAAGNYPPEPPTLLPNAGATPQHAAHAGAYAAPAPTPVPMNAPGVAALAPTSTTCPRCKSAVPNGVPFCQSCGLHIPAVMPTAPGAAGSGPAPGRGAIRPPTAEQAPTWGTAILVNRDGSDGDRYTLSGETILVGRTGCELSFEQDRFLGRPHARFERSAAGTKVVPMDQVNGVFRKLDAPVELVDRTIILVGREVLRFEKVENEERIAEPIVQHGVAMFGSPPREPWGRIVQLLPNAAARDIRYLSAPEFLLGREEGDWVFRDDAFMSRRHAMLSWDGRRCLFTDQGSSNGSFVRLSAATPVRAGDQLRMGDQLLRLEINR